MPKATATTPATSSQYPAKVWDACSNQLEFQARSTAHGWMSNLHPCVVVVEDLTFNSVEHCFQYTKLTTYGRHDAAQHVLRAPTPATAKRRGGRRAAPLSSEEVREWEHDGRSIDAMRAAVAAKFRGSKDLRDRLVDTFPAVLVERVTPFGDMKWGVNASRFGRNIMGVILMELRTELMQDADAS
jgi:ribA/ribD-fused uncharacterized protein